MDHTLAITDLTGGADPAARDAWELAVRRALADHGGREIDKTDGFLLLFAGPGDAVRWAEALHAAAPGLSRVGIHVGPALLRENSAQDVALGAKPLEVDGLAKPVAARVMSIARGGQSLLTAEALAAIGPTGLRVVSHGHWRVKGVAEPIELFEVGGDRTAFEPPPDAAKSYRVVRGSEGWVPVREIPRALPADRTDLVGRAGVLRAVADAFRGGAASVALVGGHGSGRSRIANRYAWAWLAEHPGGAWACPCGGATRPADVDGRIAEVVDPAGAGRCLVVLEDLAPELAPDTLARWRARAPDARFLVVTTESVPADAVVGVPPLGREDAIALFDSRAREADRSYAPSEDDRAALAELVEALGCAPAALEEAARRVRLLSPRALLAHHRRGPAVDGSAFEAGQIAAEDAATADPVRAVLVTDVVGSTALVEELGDARMAQLWADHDRAARDLLRVHRGREIDRTDGLLMLFDTAEDALSFAGAYHDSLAALTPPMRARAGLHVGPVELRTASAEDLARGAKPLDVQGRARQVAERVMALAPGGGTLHTSADLPGVDHGTWRFRGLGEPVPLRGQGTATAPPEGGRAAWQVVWDGDLWIPTRPPRFELPSESYTFVGRQGDLEDLGRRLDAGARLITLLGMGGTGKTRLALRLARARLGEYPGGVVFSEVAEARDAVGIARAVARALGLILGGEDPVARVGDALLGSEEILVVLDNFEQVARFAEDTVGAWLDRAPSARFVVTSREVLGLPGEHAVALGPLDVGHGVALFCERARLVRPGFEPTGAELETIGRIVAQADGLPLAVELAAAQVDRLELDALLARLTERLHGGGRRGRQATLTATLDWSWGLLDPALRVALSQLSVFEGGFALDAVDAVIDLPALDALQALVDRSLVRRVRDARFDLLVTVKEYAAAQLDAAGGRAEAEERHCRWFAAYGNEGGEVRGLSDTDNLVAATRRAVLRGQPDLAGEALMGAWAATGLRGPFALGVELAVLVEAMPNLTTAARARVDFVLGRAFRLVARHDEVPARLEAAREAFVALGDWRNAAHVLGNIGATHLAHGRYAEAKPLLLEALAEARASGHARLERTLLGLMGMAEAEMGAFDEAMSWFERALAANRAVGDQLHEGHAWYHMGQALREVGRFEDSAEAYGESLRLARRTGDTVNEAHTLRSQGSALTDIARDAEAEAALRASIRLSGEQGDRRGVGVGMGNLGNLLRTRGRRAEARPLLEEALALHRAVGFRYGQGYWLVALGQLEIAEGRPESALALALEAAETASPYPGVHYHVLGGVAEVQMACGDLVGARATVDRAKAIAPGAMGMIPFVDVLLCLADGDLDRAAQAWADAEHLDVDRLPGIEAYAVAQRARAALAAASRDPAGA